MMQETFSSLTPPMDIGNKLFLQSVESLIGLATCQTTFGWSKLSTDCKNNLFPMSIGGVKDEKVSCIINDEKNN
jgi:hypothetical protein